MTRKIIRSIAIVGGGSSAWLTAAYLNKFLPHIKITLIDKEESTPVGVGEATTTLFKEFMDQCGFDFYEWFTEVDATFKSGILFPGWKDYDSKIWHPFLVHPFFDVNELSYNVLELWSNHQDLDYKTYGTGLHDISLKNKMDPKELGAYAYHLDCLKLVKFIENKLRNKITIIKSSVEKVYHNDKNVWRLDLETGSTFSADLYVDCTGWQSILKKEKNLVDTSDRLFTNTAIAGHIPYVDRNKEMHPYVISEAVDHGWIWNIPIKDRIGSGIVFNRDITDIETAKDYFVKYWDNRITKDQLKVLRWNPYYYSNFWDGNVVGIGLSAGFIEPLESTGLALAMVGAMVLRKKIGDSTFSIDDIDSYNLDMKIQFEDCIDFVSMHYSQTNRTEPFWQYVKEKYRHTDKISCYIELLKDWPRDSNHVNNPYFLSMSNWSCWLIQLGYPCGPVPLNIPKNVSRNVLLHIADSYKNYLDSNGVDHHAEVDRINALISSRKRFLK